MGLESKHFKLFSNCVPEYFAKFVLHHNVTLLSKEYKMKRNDLFKPKCYLHIINMLTTSFFILKFNVYLIHNNDAFASLMFE